MWGFTEFRERQPSAILEACSEWRAHLEAPHVVLRIVRPRATLVGEGETGSVEGAPELGLSLGKRCFATHAVIRLRSGAFWHLGAREARPTWQPYLRL